MKNEIYRDEIYESSMNTRLELTRKLFQNCLDAWAKLDLTICASTNDLYSLVWDPAICFQEGCNVKSLPPEGVSDKVKQEHAARVVLPNPNRFYQEAGRVEMDQYSARELSLFTVKGDQVVINDKAAEPIIKDRSVYASTDKQVAFHKDLDKLIDLFNSLNVQVYGKLTASDFRENLGINARDPGDSSPISIKSEKLQELISLI